MSCSHEAHAALKADAERFAAETYPIGLLDVGDGEPIALFNCRTCASTLAKPEVR